MQNSEVLFVKNEQIEEKGDIIVFKYKYDYDTDSFVRDGIRTDILIPIMVSAILIIAAIIF